MIRAADRQVLVRRAMLHAMPQDRYSDDAVRKATGQGWDHWFRTLDSFGQDLGHTERAKQLAAAAPEVPGWWVQGITVEYERERGLRKFGQASKGDFQVSVSKTAPWTAAECYRRVVATPLLANAEWTEGATWNTDGGRVEVRRADGKMLRWFWFDADGKSTVVVDFVAGEGKTQIVVGHSGLASAAARDLYRAKWKEALGQVVR